MRFVLEIANHKNISKQRSARYILLHEQVPGRLFFLKAPNVWVISPATKVQVGKYFNENTFFYR